MRINGKQEQMLFYLYELRNTPERGVGPDPRLTIQSITEGTQISIGDIKQMTVLGAGMRRIGQVRSPQVR